jgi:stage II sporulation protein D
MHNIYGDMIMKITHNIVNYLGENKIYIYLEIADEFEFGMDFDSDKHSDSVFNTIKNYLKKVKFDKKDIAILIINGVLIGTLSLSLFLDDSTVEQQQLKQYEEQVVDIGKSKETLSEEAKEKKEEIDTSKFSLKQTNYKPESNIITSKNTTTSNSIKPVSNKNSIENNNEVTIPNSQIKDQVIKLNNNGNIININLEDYVIGVVAAEMPASFHIEALKAQAIASRTFAQKKISEGVILQNSTAHQVYKDEAALKKLWGNSYNTYYNKIKNAVESTKGLVLTYNGKYIDALYHSMSNSKTELPKYIWGNNVAYLQSVSSNWDTKVSNFKVDTKISYQTLSTKLGFTVNSNTEFTVLSQTVSGRVDSIKIGQKTYSGVSLRTILGLRSTDFKFVKNQDNVIVTTLRLWTWSRYESVWSK